MNKIMRRIIAKKILIILLTTLLASCAGSRPKIDIPAVPPPPPPIKKPIRVALVLGAGGARGYAHLGVLQVLQWAGVPIDLIVGASAGSYVGALFADSLNATTTYHTMMNAHFWDMADIGIPNLQGIMTGYRLEKYMLRNMRAHDFNQLKIKYIATTTDLLTGASYVIQSGPVAPAVTASSAIPGVVRPQQLYGRVLIDGGVADPVPVDIAKQFHPDIIIAVDISEELLPRLPTNAYDIYERAYTMMWKHLTTNSLKGSDIIIQPAVGQVGMFDIDDRYQMYLAGYTATLKALPKIQRLLQKKQIAVERSIK